MSCSNAIGRANDKKSRSEVPCTNVLLTAHEAIMRPFGIIFELGVHHAKSMQKTLNTYCTKQALKTRLSVSFIELQFMKKKTLPVQFFAATNLQSSQSISDGFSLLFKELFSAFSKKRSGEFPKVITNFQCLFLPRWGHFIIQTKQ